jgi:predicted Zn finger-like uncharacterized protein
VFDRTPAGRVAFLRRFVQFFPEGVVSTMIIQCQGCAAKYFLPEDKVPVKPIKVRCPKCSAVFTLVPRLETTATGRPGRMPEAAVAAKPAAASVPGRGQAPPRPRPAEPAPAAPKAAAPAPAAPAPHARGKSKDDRAKRLARTLVSDILCYNKEKRDQALQEGNLMTALGEEIKKSWELYKEKVGPDVASSTNYFKEALNEILANGQEVF